MIDNLAVGPGDSQIKLDTILVLQFFSNYFHTSVRILIWAAKALGSPSQFDGSYYHKPDDLF